MHIKLTVVSGRPEREEHELVLPTMLGRSAKFVIDHDAVSRFHCGIFARDGGVWISDLDSSNGTFVNGERITETQLAPGDKLRVGPLTCEIQFDPAAAAAPDAAAAPLEPPAKSSIRETRTDDTLYISDLEDAAGQAVEVRHDPDSQYNFFKELNQLRKQMREKYSKGRNDSKEHLDRVVRNWPTLPDETREAILKLVDEASLE